MLCVVYDSPSAIMPVLVHPDISVDWIFTCNFFIWVSQFLQHLDIKDLVQEPSIADLGLEPATFSITGNPVFWFALLLPCSSGFQLRVTLGEMQCSAFQVKKLQIETEILLLPTK